MSEEKSLRVIKIAFITKDGEELEKEKLSNEQYQQFCNKFESSRIKHEIRWHEFDERYGKKE